MGFNDYISLVIVISYIFIIQSLVINSVYSLKIDEKSKLYDTYYTLKIINFAGLAYAFLGIFIGIFLIGKIGLEPYYASALIAILYLGITIANCVYVYKLPEEEDTNTKCNFEVNSQALRIYSVVSTVVTAVIGIGIFVIKLSNIGECAAGQIASQIKSKPSN